MELVLRHDALKLGKRLGLGQGGVEGERLGQTNTSGQRRVNQSLHGREANNVEHSLAVSSLGTHVAGEELVVGREGIDLGREGRAQGLLRTLNTQLGLNN